jgi:uncharacterized protein with von Willebrand factor type A (vWA) domain
MSFNYGFDDDLTSVSGDGNSINGSEPDAPQLNAIEHDRWSEGVAARFLHNNPYLKSRVSRQLGTHAQYQDNRQEQLEQLFSDSFSLFFSGQPAINESCDDSQKLKFFSELMETSDIQAQRQSTKYKTSRSLAAANAIVDAYGDYLGATRQSQQPSGGASDKHWSEQSDDSQSSGGDDSLALEDAVNKATETIDKELDELDDVANQFFPGDGHQECSDESVDNAALYKTFQRIRKSGKLHDIAKYAGKYIQLAKSTRKNKSPHGCEDRNGIKFGKKPTHLTISELGKARNPKMRLDLMRRMVDNKAVVRNIHGYDSMGKGPIVVVLDESGSMFGSPIVHAKAIAMTFAWIAKKQRRWCCMVSYEGGGRTRKLSLGTGKWDQQAMCDYLEEFLCGGGYVDLPIRELPNEIYPTLGAPKGKTDVIMISDGEYSLSNIETDHINRFNKWRKSEGASVTSICIASRNAEVLASVSDVVHVVPELSEDNSKIGKAFASV